MFAKSFARIFIARDYIPEKIFERFFELSSTTPKIAELVVHNWNDSDEYKPDHCVARCRWVVKYMLQEAPFVGPGIKAIFLSPTIVTTPFN